MVTMLKNKCSVWKRIKFPKFWYNCYYFTWSDTYFIQLETLLINHPSYIYALHMYIHIHDLHMHNSDCTAVSRMQGYGDTKTMCSTRFLEEETHHNSYDMCTLPNLFKMNLFQQQRHMKWLSFCECCNEHYMS